MNPSTRTTTALVALAVAATLSGCGGSSGSSAGSSSAATSATVATSSATSTSSGATSTSSSAPATTSTSAGAATPSAATLVDGAMASMRSARSVHLTAKGMNGGTPMTLDLEGPTRGNDVRATVDRDGRRVEMVRKGTRLFVREGKAGAPLSGPWIDASGKSAPGLDGVTIEKVAAAFARLDATTEAELKTAKVTPTTVDGVAAYSLTDPSGKNPADRVVITARGPHRFASIVSRDAKEGGSQFVIRFDRWDAVAPIVVPPGA